MYNAKVAIFITAIAFVVGGCSSSDKDDSHVSPSRYSQISSATNSRVTEKIGNDAIEAEYVSAEGDTAYVVFNNSVNTATVSLSNGSFYILTLAISGSGSRYTDEDESTEFWIKGDAGTLRDNGKVIFDGMVKNSMKLK